MSVTEGSEGNKITNEVFVRLCVCVCVWNRTMHVAFLLCQPRPLIGRRPGGHFIHSCVAERKKTKHSHTPENLPIFEKSRTYSRLLSHSRGQRTCKLRRAREAVTSDWPSDEKRPLASITFALVFNKSNQKGKKKKITPAALLSHSSCARFHIPPATGARSWKEHN